jgi:hypothetical protein
MIIAVILLVLLIILLNPTGKMESTQKIKKHWQIALQ